MGRQFKIYRRNRFLCYITKNIKKNKIIVIVHPPQTIRIKLSLQEWPCHTQNDSLIFQFSLLIDLRRAGADDEDSSFSLFSSFSTFSPLFLLLLEDSTFVFSTFVSTFVCTIPKTLSIIFFPGNVHTRIKVSIV